MTNAPLQSLAAHSLVFNKPAQEREATAFFDPFAIFNFLGQMTFHIDEASDADFGESKQAQVFIIPIIGRTGLFFQFAYLRFASMADYEPTYKDDFADAFC